MRIPLLLPALALALAGCGGNDQDGASISLKTGDGDTAASLNGSTGQIAVDVPGFKGQLALPELKLDASDVELNGVTLYPGSVVRDMRIDADAGNGADRVAIEFDSPAAATVVRDWFRERLDRAGFDLRIDGNALVGTTNEAEPFRLDLAPGTDGATRGTIAIGA